jgi:hypothetical protein
MLMPELTVPILDTGGMTGIAVVDMRSELTEAIGRRTFAAAQVFSRETA